MNEQVDKGSSGVVNNVIALFLLLGGALLSGAWSLFAAELVDPALVADYGSFYAFYAPTPAIILASYGPVTLLALIGALALRRRDGALGALVVPLLVLVAADASRIVEALVTLTSGQSSQDSWDGAAATYIPALSTLVGLLVALLAHRVRAGRLLAFALVGWAFAFASSLREAIFIFFLVNGSDDYYSLFENQAWSLWWLLPAGGLYLYARRAAQGTDADRARATIARIFGGLALIGTMLTSGIFSVEVFPLAAVATLVVSLLLVLLALRERKTDYLWPSAAGIFAALSVINGVYFSEALGLSGALLVEGLLLLGVGGATFALRSRLVGQKSSS